jgi:NADH-quinone oxidoreductase subunit J
MSLHALMLFTFEGIAAISAAGLLLIRNVFHGVLLLMVSLLAIAGIYVLCFAEFVAVTQVLIYAGGVLVLIIFGIMLTMRVSDRPLVVEHTFVLSGILSGLLLFGLLAYSLSLWQSVPIGIQGAGPEAPDIGIALMTSFVLPFEVAGLLLLTALVGAAIISSFPSPDTKHT